MKIYQLSQPQKIICAVLLAVSASVSVMLVLATRESAAQFAAIEKVMVTKEVKLHAPVNKSVSPEINLPTKKAEVTTPAVMQPAAKSVAQPVTSGSWKMGGAKTPAPKISLSEQISSYAVVELEQIPEVLPVEGQQIALPLLDGKTIVANVQSVVTNPNGDYTWSGHLQGYGDDYPIIMTYGEHSIFATITTPEGSYTMESLDGLGWLYKNPAEIELSSAGANDFLEVNAIQ